MSVLGDIWNRITGKQPDKAESPMSPHDRLAVEAGRQEKANAAARHANAVQEEKVRTDSKEKASNIAKSGPAERMSYKQMYTERAQAALKQEREKQIAYEKNIASGRVQTPIDRTVSRLPERSSGPDR